MSKEGIKKLFRQKRKELMKKENVVGFGRGVKTNRESVEVFVQKKVPLVDLKVDDVVPSEIDGIKTNVIEVGNVFAHDELVDYNDRKKTWRPCPAGVSISHYKVTAGTFGCVVRDNAGRRLILSNNHILANDNDTLIGDPIFQPGSYDGGTEEHIIARLEKYIPLIFENDDIEPPPPKPPGGICPIANFVKHITKFLMKPINFFARLFNSRYRLEFQLSKMESPGFFIEDEIINTVDAAVACPIDDRMVLDIMIDGPVLNGTISEPGIGLHVSKSGRTSGLTHGEIIAVDATFLVSYGDKKCLFENQIVTTAMSEPGDSGSIVWSVDRAVGLLFAGSTHVTISNPIEVVLNSLKVKLEKSQGFSYLLNEDGSYLLTQNGSRIRV